MHVLQRALFDSPTQHSNQTGRDGGEEQRAGGTIGERMDWKLEAPGCNVGQRLVIGLGG